MAENNANVKVRSILSPAQVVNIASECFGLDVEEKMAPKELNGYDDRNFYIKGRLKLRGNQLDNSYKNVDQFLLKITNSYDTPLKLWYEVIDRLMSLCHKECKQSFEIPLPIKSVNSTNTCCLYEIPLQRDVTAQKVAGEAFSNDSDITMDEGVEGSKIHNMEHIVRLFVFIPGRVISTNDLTEQLAFNCGVCIAMLDQVMQEFPAPEKDPRSKWIWNLLYASEGIREPFVSSMHSKERIEILTNILDRYDRIVKPRLAEIPKQWIHGDPNQNNILLNDYKQSSDIVGIIDFNDATYSHKVVDLATCLMYITAISPIEKCIDYAKELYRGYTSRLELSDSEIIVLFPMVLVRYAQSCSISEYQYKCDPGNEYLVGTAKKAWEVLDYLMTEGENIFMIRPWSIPERSG